MELRPADLAPRDPQRAWRRLLAASIIGLSLAFVAVNLLYAAAERTSVDHPPNWPEFYAGVVAMALAMPFVAVSFRAQGGAHAMAWIGAVFVALALLCAIGILQQPPY